MTDGGEAVVSTRSPYAAGTEALAQWAEDGRFVQEDILKESHAPASNRVMRSFTQVEILDLIGQKHKLRLRAFVKEQVAPRYEGKLSGERLRLTIADFYAFMAAEDLLPKRPAGARVFRGMIGAYKGGSAKSALTLALAHYLGQRFWRVLVIDGDPQATLTKAFGLTPEHVSDEDTIRPVFDAIENQQDIPALRYVDTHLPTVKLTPANLRLMQADISLAVAFQKQVGSRFYEALDTGLAQVEEEFDFILIDTPPAFSFVSVATAWAANSLILPMPAAIPDFCAAFDFCEMVGELISSIERTIGMTKEWDPVLVVHSKVDGNRTAEKVRTLSKDVFGEHRLEAYVPTTAAVSNAFGEFKSVFEAVGTAVDPRSLGRAREAYSLVGAKIEEIVTDIWARQVASGE